MCIKLVTKVYCIFLLGVLLIAPGILFAQNKYTYERLNSENGLPANGIKGLHFDEKNRFLWIATESGIVRYNGHSVQSFDDISSNENLNGRIVFFEKAINGTLFGKLIDESIFTIENNKAVIKSNTTSIKSQKDFVEFKYLLPKSKVRDEVSAVEYSCFKIDTNIYFITNDNRVQKIKQISNGITSTLSEFSDGEQGFMYEGRLFMINNSGKVTEVMPKKNSSIQIAFIARLKIPALKQGSTSKNFKIFQNQPTDDVYLLRGTDLYKINLVNNKFSLELISNTIPKYEFIRHLQIDSKTKTIYLGTDNRGVIVAHPQYFNRVLPNNLVEGVSTSTYAQVELANGNIQINTGQVFGTSKIKATLVFHKPSGTSTLTTKNNKIYFTNSEGISIHNTITNTREQFPMSAFVNRNNFIEVDGNIYGFNEHGVIKQMQDGNWKLISKFKNVPFNFIVYQLALIKDNVILAATTDGLYKYSVSKNTFDLLYRDKTKANFRSIFNLGDYFLLGTYGGGVYMYKSDTIKQLPLDQNGYLKFTHCFLEDDQQRIWASTNKGVFMAPKQSLINFWQIGPGKIIYKYFGKLDGIDMLEMNGGCSPCAIKLKNGIFSFPGIDGLIQFNPKDLVDLNIIPNIYLDKLVVDNKVVKENSANNIASNAAKISMHLGISGMLSQENIRLEYRLDENAIWNPILINNAVLNIENPGFGKHQVFVRSRSTYNPKWEEQVYSFKINYPWYLNPWMYIIYLFTGLGLVFMYIRFKTIIYQRRQKVLESEVALKTASLNKVNDYLLKRNQAKDHVIAIMNHDILTPLKYLHITAKNVADISQEDKVKLSVNQIAKTTKELEYLTSNMLNWVKFDNTEVLPAKQIVDLHELVAKLLEFVKPFNQKSQLEIVNTLPEGVIIKSWPDTLRVLLYNIIVNAIKSTVKGHVTISYSQICGNDVIAIQDTGIGMSKSMINYLLSGNSEDGVEHLPKYKNGNGVGYLIIRNIIKLMGAKIMINSIEGQGTNVSIYLNN